MRRGSIQIKNCRRLLRLPRARLPNRRRRWSLVAARGAGPWQAPRPALSVAWRGFHRHRELAAEVVTEVYRHAVFNAFGDGELLATGMLPDDWDEGEIVEILGVVALFGYLNRWNDSMGTQLEEPAAEDGEKYLSKTGWNRGKHKY